MRDSVKDSIQGEKMKITKEEILAIKELKEKGDSIRSIAEVLGVSHSTIAYHLDKDKIRRNQKKWWNNLPKERKKEYYDRRKDYLAKYMKNKYNSDPEFREKKKASQRDYYKNKFAEVVKGGQTKE